jgi:hypothetical protein
MRTNGRANICFCNPEILSVLRAVNKLSFIVFCILTKGAESNPNPPTVGKRHAGPYADESKPPKQKAQFALKTTKVNWDRKNTESERGLCQRLLIQF